MTAFRVKLLNAGQHAVAAMFLSRNRWAHFVGDKLYRMAFWVYRRMHPLAEEIQITANSLVAQGRASTADAVAKDIQREYYRHGFAPCDYAAYYFERKKPQERRRYWSREDLYVFANVFSDREEEMSLNDKEATYKRFTPYYKRECIKVTGPSDWMLFQDFTSRHRKFFVKPVNSYGGHGARVVETDTNELRQQLARLTEQGACVLEQLVEQSHLVAQFNESSVNTVRVSTLFRHGEVRFLFAIFRMGRAGRVVDNCTAGGLFAMIDLDSGILNSHAFIKNTGEMFEKHPDSGLAVKGFQIPFWGEICCSCEKLARGLQKIPYVSWDWAITDDGPVLVEANVSGEMIFEQAASGVGMKDKYESLYA